MIVELEIRTWSGTNVHGVHYYGVLRCPGQRPTRLERIIDAKEAEWLNKYDNTPGIYKAGFATERFRSAEQVRDKAQEVWAKKYPEATELKEKA